jgi:hypothetical protein
MPTAVADLLVATDLGGFTLVHASSSSMRDA